MDTRCTASTNVSTITSNIMISLFEVLTLRGLSLFFKILPISNTGDSIAYNVATVHFLYPKLGSFSDMEYYFHQLACWDSKVPKRFIGSNQMLTGFTARKMPQVPIRVCGRGQKCKIRQQQGKCAPFDPPH